MVALVACHLKGTMVLCKSPISLTVFILTLNILVTHAVWELDRSNFDKFRKTASFPIFFVDSPSCSRCRVLYPFFYAAAQVFQSDREIFFGRVQDMSLIRQWEIEELPVILYYEKGETEWERIEGDITVDSIVATIAEALPGYIGEIKLDRVIELNDKNYEEIVITPKQSVLLLTYNSDERHTKKIFEQVAAAFRFDEQIIFCALDVEKYPEVLKAKFGHRDIPAVFWYEGNNKQKKFLFGGKINNKALLQFVNEKTLLRRLRDGQLEPTSGRVDKLDEMFSRSIPEVKEADAQQLGEIIEKMRTVEVTHIWETDFAEYYVELMEKIAEQGSPLESLKTERKSIADMLTSDDADLTQKQIDFFLRKQNIVDFMVSSINHFDEEKAREEEERRRIEEEKRKNFRPVIRELKKTEL